MALKEQFNEIKEALISQINNTFPEEKKESAIRELNSMNDSEFESFLKQNNLINAKKECIFCKIIKKEIPSSKIKENQNAIAVLEINPISVGHVLIIPKKHIQKQEELSKEFKTLSEEISEKIQILFHPKQILKYYTSFFDHLVLNILPVYTTESQDSERIKISQEELKKIQEKFNQKEKEVPEKKAQIISEKNMWLPKRIP